MGWPMRQAQDRMGGQQMPVLETIRKRFVKELPLKGCVFRLVCM